MLTQMKARSFIVLLNQFFSLLGIMIISKSLDIQSFYIFSSAIILFQVLFVITEWGFAFYSINFFKKNSDNKIKNYLVILIFASKFILLLCIIFVISIFFYLNSFIFKNYPIFLSFIFLIISAGLNPLWFYQSINKPEVLMWPTLVSKIIYLSIIFFVFIFFNIKDVHWAIVAQGISFAIVSYYGYYKLKDFKITFDQVPPLVDVIKLIKSNFNFFISEIILNYCYSLWGILILIFGNSIQIIIFNISDLVLKSGIALTQSIPEILLGEKKKEKLKKYILISIIVLFFCSIVGFLVAPFFIEIFFGNKYLIALNVLYIVIILWFVISTNKIFIYGFMADKFSLNKLNKLNIYFSFLHVLFIIFWIYHSSYDALSLSLFILTINLLQVITMVIINYFSNRIMFNK